ncbi:hypothetical protein [Gramella sp. KN1008]|uniref:hypothetical protein n=1 Tax=Gramella sp. KN1008 TaxID=2529298 RepID=UPI00103A105C|nr:hypothetical protein [Gramella sp. KN1008]TBW29284.1 hypothetical protein EZJ28_05210 [Gramella sp. KN1008]
MVKLLSRKECLETNLILAAVIQKTQASVYAPDKNGLLFIPGENYIEEEQRWVDLSEKECEERNRPVLQNYEEVRDKIPAAPELENFKAQAILGTETENFIEQVQLLSKGLNYFNKELQWEGMLFIPDYPYPWLENLDAFRDKKMISWLRSNGVVNDFAGGIYADGEDLKEWISLLIRLKVDNVDFPECSFAGAHSAAIGFICKHGNIHFVFYEDNEKSKFDKTLDELDLIDLPFGAC